LLSSSASDELQVPALSSPLLDRIVLPAVEEPWRLFAGAMSRISIADLQLRGRA